MRVRGDTKPPILNINPYGGDTAKVEVRLCENIKPYEEKIESTNETIKGYEYDEYMFILNDEPNLKDKIENNLADWFATGKNLEIDTKASLYVSAKMEAIDAYTKELVEGGIL